MAKIACLFASFVAFVQVATSLDCYSCGQKEPCSQNMTKWQRVLECGKVANSPKFTGACLKRVYIEKTTNKEITVRSCITAEKNSDGTVSHTCDENEGKVLVCEYCTTDFCNSASTINFSLLTFLGVVAAYLVPRFM